MVHPLSIVCRSVVWFAVLLVSSDGRVAGCWRSSASFVWRGLSDATFRDMFLLNFDKFILRLKLNYGDPDKTGTAR